VGSSPVRIAAYGRGATIADQLDSGVAASLVDEVKMACTKAGIVTIDVVPAAQSLVVVHSNNDSASVQLLLTELLANRRNDNLTSSLGNAVEIPVRYDGDDLDEVARACGMSVDRVVDLHSSTTYTVEFCGFAPGFAYLRGLPEQLHLPRRASPRTRVPAGSVAIATTYSAIYPSESPGGWHLIGTTSLRIWDSGRTPPALLQPGTTVRFVNIS